MEEDIRLETEELEETAEQPAEELAPRDILYRTDTVKNPWFYDYAPVIGVILAMVAVCVLGIFMVLDANPLTKILGVVGTVAFTVYAGRFLYHFVKSRKSNTIMAHITEDTLTVECEAWKKEYKLSDIVYTSSYSSSTNMCVIAATEDDYLTIRCSCGYLFTSDGKDALRPFYALNKRMMEMNPAHVNYIKNKKYKRKNPYQIPLYIFEVEYDTPRVTKLISELREKYRIVPAAEGGSEE